MAAFAHSESDRVVLLCRPGFESDCAQEIQWLAQRLNVYGYIKTESRQGYVEFIVFQPTDLTTLAAQLNSDSLMFARDLMVTGAAVSELDTLDRVSGMLDALAADFTCSTITPWTNDDNEGKSLAKLSRKLVKPLRNALEQRGQWQDSAQQALTILALATDRFYLGSLPVAAQPKWPNSIAHLKFPSQAPSRSTLKLEEAILFFLTAQQQENYFGLGKTAVDLGACPGGWTYQLVRREVQVFAIDNGAMDEGLMASGQVEHIKADGFVWRPQHPVTWLVCDMIEQPARVAALMADWLADGSAERALFNLKLPMKKRFQEVLKCCDIIAERLHAMPYDIKVKQLYHDREEVTVYLARTA